MRQSQQALFNDINITPLTDIFLVLLIIMMVVAPMLDYRGIDMALAVKTGKPEKNAEDKYVHVAIAPDGQYTVGGKPAGAGELARIIREEMKAKPEGVFIEADSDATHAALAHAMDAAQVAGVQNVSVAESAPPPPSSPANTKGSSDSKAK